MIRKMEEALDRCIGSDDEIYLLVVSEWSLNNMVDDAVMVVDVDDDVDDDNDDEVLDAGVACRMV
jgi:hypothetical protein